jgi:uncharacterized protein (TIGR02246 family)
MAPAAACSAADRSRPDPSERTQQSNWVIHMRPIFNRLHLLPVAAIVAASAFPAYAGPQSSTQVAIKAENDRWAEAFKRGDYLAIGKLYTEDGTLLQPGGERIRGAAAIVDYFTKGYAGKPPSTVTFDNFEFYGNDEAVTEVSTATIRGQDGKIQYVGKQTLIFLKQGKAWKLHRDMWNDDGPIKSAED